VAEALLEFPCRTGKTGKKVESETRADAPQRE
jgi:hypothetical protein